MSIATTFSPSASAERRSVIDEGASLERLVEHTERQFQRRFHRAPRWLAAAPGRVNLIGEHTDYNDGFVLPMAIERYVVVAVDVSRKSTNGYGAHLYTAALDKSELVSFESPDVAQMAPWARYVYGVMVGCRERGMQFGPLDVAIQSNVPLGGGLSSSAALEVATATSLEAVTGQSLNHAEKALLCQKAEHQYAGVPCGIMDQFTSVMGRADHLMLLDCRTTEVKMVPLADPAITVLIVNSNVKHELTGGEYAQRRRQCESAAQAMGVASLRDASLQLLERSRPALDPLLYRRARHVISENDRTTRTADAIEAGDWRKVGELMYASHDSLRVDYEVSCRELDLLVDLAREVGESGGVIGSRMTGGGFGGCTVTLVRREKVETAARLIAEGYQEKTGVQPTVFTSRPARGAHIVQLDCSGTGL
jgi:galactokinase